MIELQVNRVFPAESGLVSSDLVLISADDFRRIFGAHSGVATDLSVRVRNPQELSTIALKVA